MSAFDDKQATVSSTVTDLSVPTGGYSTIVLVNASATETVYLGNDSATLSTSNGFPLLPGKDIALAATSAVALYGITEGADAVVGWIASV